MSTRGNVVAYLALFVSLGGTSYAAVGLSAGSVGTRQLRNGAVTNAKVRPRSLTSGVFAPGTLPHAGFRTTTVISGTKGVSCMGSCGPFDAGFSIAATAVCPAGSRVLGGGYDTTGEGTYPPITDQTVTVNRPTKNGDGWTATATLTQKSSDIPYLYVYAVCGSA